MSKTMPWHTHRNNDGSPSQNIALVDSQVFYTCYSLGHELLELLCWTIVGRLGKRREGKRKKKRGEKKEEKRSTKRQD